VAEVIHEHSLRVLRGDGAPYAVRVCAEPIDGVWIGWLEFHPEAAGEQVLRTERETTQPSRDAMRYWATGLGNLYLEGAFARATRGLPRAGAVAHVLDHSACATGTDGTIYLARVYAAEAESGAWIGWIEFHPREAEKPIRYTERETTQPTREMVAYWASGLQPIYLEGALARATRDAPPAQ
jgi:hypothetical protein